MADHNQHNNICRVRNRQEKAKNIAMILDKKKAIDGKFRISESALFLLSLLGGSLGGFIAMHTFHHKTRKWYFKLGIPLILVAWSALIAWLVFKNSI